MKKLKNMKLTEISLVEKPATKKAFLFAKQEQKHRTDQKTKWPSLAGMV